MSLCWQPKTLAAPFFRCREAKRSLGPLTPHRSGQLPNHTPCSSHTTSHHFAPINFSSRFPFRFRPLFLDAAQNYCGGHDGPRWQSAAVRSPDRSPLGRLLCAKIWLDILCSAHAALRARSASTIAGPDRRQPQPASHGTGPSPRRR